jgi:hypothetical protein
LKYLSRPSFWVILVYLALVSVSIGFAFIGRETVDTTWLLVVIGLTLPWSVVTFFLMWALIHGAGLPFFALLSFFFAVLNCFIGLLIRHFSNRAEKWRNSVRNVGNQS